MKINDITIENYKSIGESNNVLNCSSTITAIIGKNESGKSNILDAIGSINTLLPLEPSMRAKKTRGQDKNPKIKIEMSFTEDIADPTVSDLSTVLSFGYDTVTIIGGLSSLIDSDQQLKRNIQNLKTRIDSNAYKANVDQIRILKSALSQLLKLSTCIFSKHREILTKMKDNINATGYPEKEKECALIDEIIDGISKYYDMIPQIYYRNSDRILNEFYPIDDIEKVQLVGNTIFHNLMHVAKVSNDTVSRSIRTSDAGSKRTEQRKIINGIQKNVCDIFNNFYSQEKIVFEPTFDNNGIGFCVFSNDTQDKVMSFSERSNGLKWYFSLFIDIIAKTDANRPILYVFDEPGVYLHVNAQKELLKLFDQLCSQRGQIIYTTHSPFMIDSNNVSRIRAVEKNSDGISNIYKSVYHHELDKKSKLETLSPFLQAIGMDLKYNIGPQNDKMNLVVEGITDYFYLSAMQEACDVPTEKRPYIIPCTGVDNVERVCSILFGWGCDFKAILDYDKQGYAEYKKLVEKLLLNIGEQVFFINLCTPTSTNDVTGDRAKTIESLIEASDNDELENQYNGTPSTKTLAAKEFYDKVVNGELHVSEKTKTSFSELFSALGIRQVIAKASVHRI